MLTFEPFSLAALQRVLPYIREAGVSCSDLSGGAMYMWQEGTDLCFCEWNDTLVIRQDKGEQPAFSPPIGKDPDGMTDDRGKRFSAVLRRRELSVFQPQSRAVNHRRKNAAGHKARLSFCARSRPAPPLFVKKRSKNLPPPIAIE